jgi:hypothetical protein
MADSNTTTKRYSFTWSDDDIKGVTEQAERFREDYKKSGNFQPGIPICFFGEGNYIFRIYPDRDQHGFARIIKRAFFHNRKTGVEGLYLRCWEDDRINKLFREAQEAGLEKIWGNFMYAYRSQERGYMMVHLYESPPGNEYALPKKSYGAVLDRRQIFAIQDFIAELHPDDKRQLLDPNNAAPAIKLSITKGAGKANVSAGIASMQRLELPPLEFKDEDGAPIEYRGLDHIYITEEDKISDENFFKLKQAVTQEIVNFKSAGGNVKDLSSEGHKFGDKPEEVKETKTESNPEPKKEESNPLPDPKPVSAAVTQTTKTEEAGAIRCRLAEQTLNSPSLKEAYPNAAFGNKPNKQTPYCLVCDFERECEELTKKRKAAA